jgi:hypothetical protein
VWRCGVWRLAAAGGCWRLLAAISNRQCLFDVLRSLGSRKFGRHRFSRIYFFDATEA